MFKFRKKIEKEDVFNNFFKKQANEKDAENVLKDIERKLQNKEVFDI